MNYEQPDFRDVILLMKSTLQDLQGQRRARDWIEPHSGQPAWVCFEMMSMYWAVNDYRQMHELPPVALAQVQDAERQASGHIDYTRKFALYCAELCMEGVHDPMTDSGRHRRVQ